MNITFMLIVCAVIATGCAGKQSRQSQEFQDYMNQNKDRVERGELKRSEYYNSLYSKASAGNAPSYVLLQLNEILRAAEQYEGGSITIDEFEYRRRVANIQLRTAAQDDSQRVAAQREASSTALVASGMAMMQASQPRLLAPPQPVVAPAPQLTSLPGYLKSQSVNGLLRYCVYTNGIVNTTAVTTLCPNSAQ